MKFIKGIGWVEDDASVYPTWFQNFVKEKMCDNNKCIVHERCSIKETIQGPCSFKMSEEQHRAIFKPMNKNCRRNGRGRCE